MIVIYLLIFDNITLSNIGMQLISTGTNYLQVSKNRIYLGGQEASKPSSRTGGVSSIPAEEPSFLSWYQVGAIYEADNPVALSITAVV